MGPAGCEDGRERAVVQEAADQQEGTSSWELVEMEGSRELEGGETKLLVEGQEVWREWRGEEVDRPKWWREQKEAWQAKERAAFRMQLE